MGGRGGFFSGELGVQSAELGFMKGELRNRGRCPGGVVESRQLQFVRLPFPAASQSVAVSSSYFWDDRPKADWHPKRRKFRIFPLNSG